MRNKPSNPEFADATETAPDAKAQSGSQTLLRGLDVLDAVADGPITLADLAASLGLTRSTTHRLASALIDRRYLTFVPRLGYQLGAKLLELGFLAQRQADVIQIARPHIEALAAATEDTVHLGVEESGRALYLDKIPGRRRVEIRSHVGDRQPLTATGLGKALLLDDEASRWKTLFVDDRANGAPAADYAVWQERMERYVGTGHAFDLEENEDQIRCVAAPVRDAKGTIVAAISVSSAAQYMDDDRMDALSSDVRNAAAAISRDLGWNPETSGRGAARTVTKK